MLSPTLNLWAGARRPPDPFAKLRSGALALGLVADGAFTNVAATTRAANGQPVAAIRTAGSLGMTLTQSSLSQRPTYRTTAFRGRPAIEFVADDWLSGLGTRHAGGLVLYLAISLPLTFTQDYQCIGVLRDSNLLPGNPRKVELTGWAGGGNAGRLTTWAGAVSTTLDRPQVPSIMQVTLVSGQPLEIRRHDGVAATGGHVGAGMAVDSWAFGANWSVDQPGIAPVHNMLLAGVGMYSLTLLDTPSKRAGMLGAWQGAFGL